MAERNEKIISNPETTSSSSSELVLFKGNHIRDISLLNKNFDLSSMPSNYMRKRSKIEEIIYQAVFNQNNHKSPFASFKIANHCLPDLHKIDVVTGTNNLKKIMKSLYANNEQISIMVHKIGTTWLMDEFDLDALFHGHRHYADWDWLREFIERDRLQLAKPDLSRASLTTRDLYSKFLYHSVNQLSIQITEETGTDISPVENVAKLPILKQANNKNLQSTFNSPNNRYDHHREDFINLVDWKLNDLSFLVGSDLSIFGTKSHPCISLRLHPSQEPINILTGIDMWLENLLNEVPEVAMCYHDQGIVMREYEIFRTDDIPQITGFNKDDVESIANNLSHFLSTNATKEGHTYWLFKETDSTTVKLYDLTDIWMKNQRDNANDNNSCRQTPDGNPFILPVAVLCYKMAENRISHWHRARNKCGKANLTSSQFNTELLESKLADDAFYFNDIFRLLKNCINLLIRTDKHQDLINNAIILMCQLYLEVDQTTLGNLHHQQETQATDIVKFDLTDLKNIDKIDNVTTATTHPTTDDCDLIGSQLFQLCVKHSTEELFVKTLSILESCEIMNCNDINFTDEELLLRNTLLSSTNTGSDGKEVRTVANKKTIVKDDLFESVLNYHATQCLTTNVAGKSITAIQGMLTSGFLLALFDGAIWSKKITLSRNLSLYCNLLTSFMRWHVDLYSGDNTTIGSPLNKMDTRMINYYCGKNSLPIVTVTSFFQSIFMSESKIKSFDVDSQIHRSWYDVIVFLLRLSDELLSVPLSKADRISVLRAIPVLVNFLVGATVVIYQQEAMKNNKSDVQNGALQQWCKETVFPCIDWITRWTDMHDFSANTKDIFVALVYINKAKLYRLSMAIIDDTEFWYHAIESYTKALDGLIYSNRKKLSTICIGTKCDRLDMCIQLIERAYTLLMKTTEELSIAIVEMSKAVELCDRIYKVDLTHQGYDGINWRLMSLRLRMNYVRYYLNLKTNMPLNYEQILNDFERDLKLILAEEESISKCKETMLIMFYLIKIQADRLQILSVPYLENFLKENTKILGDIISVNAYHEYLEGEGATKLKEINGVLVNVLRKLLSKYHTDSHRKKKTQRNRTLVQQLEKYLDTPTSRQRSFEEIKDLVKEIRNFL